MAATDPIDDVFGTSGLLSKRLSGYEPRQGQVEMARSVFRAMSESRHLICEAPCGVGKSLAYLVPAIYHAVRRKKRIVIATANIALQEQLVEKDLPFLRDVLPLKFTFALQKGRNNYVCKDRMWETRTREEDTHSDRVRAINHWTKWTSIGDKSDLSFEPEEDWSKFSVSSDECIGKACRFKSECFSDKAKSRASMTDVIVTNYHMLFAHFKSRNEEGDGFVLPEFDVLVADEAHEIERVARDFYGFTFTARSVDRLSYLVKWNPKLAFDLRAQGEDFFRQFEVMFKSTKDNSVRLRSKLVRPDGMLDSLAAIHETAGCLEDGSEEGIAACLKLRKSVSKLASKIEAVVLQEDENSVYFVKKGNGFEVSSKLVDVSDVLSREMFGMISSVSLVSATLAIDGNFDFARGDLGVPDDATELAVESPFDFEDQAFLITPPMPNPNAAGFIVAMNKALLEIIQRSKGRTLVLFTSNDNLNAAHQYLKGKTPYLLLKQGDAPRTELTRRFKEVTDSVLLGTNSFWTGIDVPGQALTTLVIDKLPFPVPSDPVVEFINEKMGKDAFPEYSLPRAAIMLRQGVGRLIRSKTDVGVVVVLDPRLDNARYSKKLLACLPSMSQSREISSITAVLERMGV